MNIPRLLLRASPTTLSSLSVHPRHLCTPAQSSTTVAKPIVPNVPSTSLGLFQQHAEADANDPNKWKKFVWKYAGAVLLFMISYKSLHWYVDRLEADAKQRRQNLEEDKQLARQIRAAPAAGPTPLLSPIQPQQETQQQQSQLFGAPSQDSSDSQPQNPLQLLEQMSAPVPPSSSELDELYAYRLQLQSRLQSLPNPASSDPQSPTEIRELNEELEALVVEIRQLEAKKSNP